MKNDPGRDDATFEAAHPTRQIVVTRASEITPCPTEWVWRDDEGNGWFANQEANTIGRMTPDGDFDEFMIPTPNSLPQEIVFGPDGNLWFTEYNGSKIGRLTPGTHIPIVHEKDVKQPPDYYLILSWNFLEYLIAKYKGFLLAGGKFIVPVPDVRVLGLDSVRGS